MLPQHQELFQKLQQPLDPSHLEHINSQLELNKAAFDAIQKAKDAGMDVREHHAKLTDMDTKLRQIKQVYFPNQP